MELSRYTGPFRRPPGQQPADEDVRPRAETPAPELAPVPEPAPELVPAPELEAPWDPDAELTEQLCAELERTRALFDRSFDASPIGMTLVDARTQRLVRANEAMCRVTGRTRSQLQGLASFGEILHGDDIRDELAAIARMRDGDSDSDQRSMRYLRSDGSAVWVERHLSAVRDATGNLIAVLTHALDLSEERAREQALQRRRSEVAWIEDIRNALAEDRLVLHSQPIFDLRDGSVAQHELLLRMVGRDGTLIPPTRFLPVAERYGLISEIDRWVIARAAALAAGGMTVEINVAAESISQPDLIDIVASELERSGAPPENLVFEITETTLMREMEGGEAFARRLSALGCGFALDDFGTGFGGLTYLKRLPVDFIKIDREFVRDLVDNPRDQHLVSTLVGLARGLGQRTIAEGVEDEACLELLARFGVDMAQGFYLGRPGPLQTD